MRKKKRNIIIAGLIAFPFAAFIGLVWGLVYASNAAVASTENTVDSAASIVVVDPTDPAAYYTNITAIVLKQRLDDQADNGYVIVDIRDQASYEDGYIPTAINIPLKELGYRMFELPRTKDIIVYCYTSVTSHTACQILVNGGFKDVYNLIGGIQAWDYPIETSDGRVDI